jgi:hypothetical protein
MTRATLIRCGIATVLLGGLGVAPALDQSAPDNQLSAQVAELEKQNAELKKENAKLKGEIRQLQVQLAVTQQVVSPPAQPKVPSNWTQKQFNGITYYLVPLGGSQAEQKAEVIAK